MAQNEESFLLKEFLVGLFVLLIFLVILLFALQKATSTPFFKNLFTRGQKVVKEVTPDYCSQTVYKDIKKDQSIEFEKTVKRTGYLDTKTRYTLTYPQLEKNNISREIASTQSPGLNEKNVISCTSTGIQLNEPDKFLLSGLLNTYQDKIADFISFQVSNKNGSFLPSGNLDSGKAWQQAFTIKGAISPSNYQVTNEEKYCFSEDAKGASVVKGTEKLGDLETVKIETNWEATASAFLGARKKVTECNDYSGPFDTTAQISFKEEIWFGPGLGIVKRQLTPGSVTGQVYFLPNGYQPLTITDETVSGK